MHRPSSLLRLESLQEPQKLMLLLAVAPPMEFAAGLSAPKDVPMAPVPEVGCPSLESFEFSHCCRSCYCLPSPSPSYH